MLYFFLAKTEKKPNFMDMDLMILFVYMTEYIYA